MSVIPLQVDPHDSEKFSNITAYVNSLFSADVRSESVINSAIAHGQLHAWYTDQNSASLILRSWLAQWQHSQGDTDHPGYDHDAYERCPVSDGYLIDFLATYIKQHGLLMAIPDLVDTGSVSNGLEVYQTTGWRVKHFMTDGVWNYGQITGNNPLQYSASGDIDDTVVTFLRWLMSGAHFVVPSENDDQLNGNGFPGFTEVFSTAGLTTRRTFTSHYATYVNASCLNFLNIEGDTEPASEPLIASFVTGPTTDLGSNSFFQLEGWPLESITGGRHNADYAAYQATLWNISTYAACPYSERRSTPIFIAKSQFDLSIQQATNMPSYKGAETAQEWMHTDLLVIPGERPPVAAQVEVQSADEPGAVPA
ncbi:hypothetical protein [Longimicrobium sp.]|uniref:hypothetical protein n=1 Tax=Longimicrobium sp. TaxID=2029185 RepID=UPI002E2EBEEB|nr:hypothetical protein [Longimicrobium sp.]HEX6041075.1 hypothetical protein [Longimicrobium sp.]